ncbi:MAG: DUF2911 domain-containing protein [Deltaproteobacteria bacterium]|nr:DUF2911 domain-containing protein [Deltaproteobacteria bacterium]
MKKKIVIVVALLVVIIAGYAAWLALVGSKKSPKDTVSSDALATSVTYCRPYKKERLIFGDEAKGALVPYGKYWRLGANAATAITFSKDVTFGNKPVKAGTYSMHAFPGQTTWKVNLNSDVDRWGASEPDHSKDVVSIEVPAENGGAPVEQFTISFTDKMLFAWDTTKVAVPIAVK